jgi:hypothetical protein
MKSLNFELYINLFGVSSVQVWGSGKSAICHCPTLHMKDYTLARWILSDYNTGVERIVPLDFIHRLVSQKNWGIKIYIPKKQFFWDTRRWIKSKSTIRSIPTHHRQNPTEITYKLTWRYNKYFSYKLKLTSFQTKI